ncbi:MAG: hypothetical protein ACHP79_13885 [Terriglobales bacterium]
MADFVPELGPPLSPLPEPPELELGPPLPKLEPPLPELRAAAKLVV